jgi:trans-aconitate 2-methyltransferase
MAATNYTFGDNERASARLRLLAELYEPETRELLRRGGLLPPRIAVDLGCGPGWSTRLVHESLWAERTVGLDSSERYVAEAQRIQTPGLEFHVHDVRRVPFPAAAPNALFCRFLLTHLSNPKQALQAWAGDAASGATLFIHETETLETEHPALRRYYDLVGRLQEHYGQTLLVGAVLGKYVESNGWKLVENSRCTLHKSARHMAELHSDNLRTWRSDPFAAQTFSAAELDSLQESLDGIAKGLENAGIVVNVARQIIARRA